MTVLKEKFLKNQYDLEQKLQELVKDRDGANSAILGTSLIYFILDYLNEKEETRDTKLQLIHTSIDNRNYPAITNSSWGNLKLLKIQDYKNEEVYNCEVSSNKMKSLKSYECLWDFCSKRFIYNCFQIIYSLESKKLYYTENFLSFLDNLVIECSDLSYFNIKELLDAILLQKEFTDIKFNPSLEIKTLATSLFLKDQNRALMYGYEIRTKSPDRDTNFDYSSAYLVSSSYKELLNNEELFQPYMKLTPEKNKFVLHLNIGYKDCPHIMDHLRGNPSSSQTHSSFKFARWVSKGSLDRQKKLATLISSNIINMDSNLARKKRKFKRSDGTTAQASSNLDYFELADKAISKDFNKEDLLKLKSYFNSHHRLSSIITPLLLDYGWSTQNIIYFYNKFKKESNMVTGWLENYDVGKFNTPKTKQEAIKVATDIIEEFWVEKRKGERILVTALKVDGFTNKDNVKELVSNVDLELEGEYMKHCVGGYASSLNANHRIFHIKSNDEKESTLEIRKANDRKWKNIQHRAKRNSVPSQENINIANDLVSFLNESTITQKSKCEFNNVKKIISKSEINNEDNEIFQRRAPTYYEVEKIVKNSNSFRNFCQKCLRLKETLGLDFDADYLKSEKPPYGKTLRKQLDTLIVAMDNVVSKNGKIVVILKNTQFRDKEIYKDRGFSWDGEERAWWTKLTLREVKTEVDWFDDHRVNCSFQYLSEQDKVSTNLITRLNEYMKTHSNRIGRLQRERLLG